MRGNKRIDIGLTKRKEVRRMNEKSFNWMTAPLRNEKTSYMDYQRASRYTNKIRVQKLW